MRLGADIDERLRAVLLGLAPVVRLLALLVLLRLLLARPPAERSQLWRPGNGSDGLDRAHDSRSAACFATARATAMRV